MKKLIVVLGTALVAFVAVSTILKIPRKQTVFFPDEKIWEDNLGI